MKASFEISMSGYKNDKSKFTLDRKSGGTDPDITVSYLCPYDLSKSWQSFKLSPEGAKELIKALEYISK